MCDLIKVSTLSRPPSQYNSPEMAVDERLSMHRQEPLSSARSLRAPHGMGEWARAAQCHVELVETSRWRVTYVIIHTGLEQQVVHSLRDSRTYWHRASVALGTDHNTVF